jgi:hypothetical protein
LPLRTGHEEKGGKWNNLAYVKGEGHGKIMEHLREFIRFSGNGGVGAIVHGVSVFCWIPYRIQFGLGHESYLGRGEIYDERKRNSAEIIRRCTHPS